MKTSPYFPAILLTFCILLLLGCKSDDDTPPPGPLTINGIYPNSNPIGGPVLIEGEDFTGQIEVYFNNVKATVEERGTTFLTTKVPAGIGLGTKTVRIEDGNRVGTVSFDVLAQFPSDLPISPPSIFIPAGGVTAPISYTVEDVDKITIMNVYDVNHIIELVLRVDSYLVGEVVSNEEISIDGTVYTSPVTFDGNQYFTEDYYCEPCDIEVPMIEVHRSDAEPENHPYADDVLSGAFATMENFAFPPEALEPDFGVLTDNFFLLSSHITGRQYLFVVLCIDVFNSGKCD